MSEVPIPVGSGSETGNNSKEGADDDCSQDKSSVKTLVITPLEHHVQEELCLTRPKYRQGRKLTAVKVYTINDESVYLLLIGVPDLKLKRELRKLCKQFGTVEDIRPIPDYPAEKFAENYIVKYRFLREARRAKRNLDGRNFFGGSLHVCYAPELESVSETRQKLKERKIATERALKRLVKSSSILSSYHPDDKLSVAANRITSRLNFQTNNFDQELQKKQNGFTEYNNSNENVKASSYDHSNNFYQNYVSLPGTSNSLQENFQDDAGSKLGESSSSFPTINDTIPGPSIGFSYQSMASDYEPNLGHTTPSSQYIPSQSHFVKKIVEKNENDNKMPKSLKVYKTIKSNRKRKHSNSEPFIGPVKKDDKTLKTWNSVYNSFDDISNLEKHKKKALVKQTEVLEKFKETLKNSLLLPPSKFLVMKDSNQASSGKISITQGDKLL